MPFDVNKSSGTWKHGENSDNYMKIMEKLGVPAEMWDQLKAAEWPVNSSLSGNVMTSKVDFQGKTIENKFTMGEEGEETDPMGTKRKVIYTMEGDNLVSVYPNHDGKGLSVHTSRHFVDDNTIHVTMKVGDLEGWATSKRC
ncbi:fatty acid-binding protein, liver-type-like [Branchiostoma lanceolatum]|uniref:fatty acid-binding protein, liver-type-like n=1 Tax=Branchiostoma lanceolatum TaxID=7740 RepID=UPI0034536E09